MPHPALPLTILSVGAIVAFVLSNGIFHVVEEGHRGLYYTLGALSSTVTEPGLHLRLPPPFQTAIQVHVRPEVDTVRDLKCTAKDGTMITFPAVDVGNTLPAHMAHGVVKQYGKDYDKFLVYDQVKALVNTICATYTSHEIKIEKYSIIDDDLKEGLEEIQERLGTGLLIDNVRINEVRLPLALQKAYEQQATNRAEKKAAEEAYKRIEQENINLALEVQGQNELLRLKAAEEDKILVAREEAKLGIERRSAEARNAIALAEAKNEAEIRVVRARAEADAVRSLAEANAALHTDAYLQLKAHEALAKNAKVIFGNQIPKGAFAVEALARQASARQASAA
jgi:regulator of protease activity HflC (stomatin/prohibitin superfamily)